jgi:hypothetical protein
MDLIYEFGADVTQFNASIADVTKEIKKLKDTLKTATGAEIPKLNAEISALQTSLGNLKNVGVPAAAAISKVRDSASDARVALTNVSQVVQDLPFGFIGIQNNIPGVIQAFGNLTSGSTGLVGGLKAISAQLLGPAGIFLAFSVVTSAVTGLITKYGSLGAGLEAVFGSTVKLTQAQKDYNKALSESVGSSAAEVIEINALVKILGDLSKPLQERYSAYVELNKIRPEVVAGISEESLAIGNYTKQLDINATAIRNLIFLEAKRAALTSVINKNVTEQTALEQDRPRLIADLLKAQKDEAANAKKIEQGLKTQGRFRTQESQNLLLATKAYTDNIKKQNELIKSYREYADSLAPVITNIADVDGATKKLNDSLKEQQKVIKATKPPKPDKEIKLFDFLGYSLPKNIKDDFEATLKEFEKSYNKFTRLIKNKDKFLKPTLSPFQLQKPTLEGLQTDETKAKLLELQNIAQGYLRVKDLLQNTFFQPLNSAFETLFTKGTFAIKDFTNALLTSIGQIAAKLAATAIVNGLISIFAVPFGGAFAAGGLLGGIGNLLGGIGGRAGSANFGGVQGGGMGMSGSVNMVLRGTDLVGSINRTNSQISRVG